MRDMSLDRRDFLKLGLAGTMAGAVKISAAPPGPPVLVFIHGRDQQGKDPAALKAEWIAALASGAKKISRTLPSQLEVVFPYYGDKLDELTQRADIPLASDIQARGESAVNEDFLSFQAEVAESLRVAAGVTDQQVDTEYGANPKPKGPLNWEWVQALLRGIDKHGGGVNEATLQTFTRDVFLYTRRAGVRDEIDRIVADVLSVNPTVVVAHSLGTVVAYSVLRNDRRALQVPLLVTVGSPLGVRAIRDQFKPLRRPQPVGAWYNAFDPRDVVALYPLDSNNFPITPNVENAANVNNATSNRHGIAGYLDDPGVAGRILDALGP